MNKTVLQETLDAYSDCNELSNAQRNLSFLASEFVYVDDAIEIFDKAVIGYNEFEPYLLEFFKDFDVMIKPARESSVCIYVSGMSQKKTVPKKWFGELVADEIDYEGDLLRVWWD